ncbi:hypothetical protein [Tenacibaculum mesophilum]|uniref:hypothetical protein n=1 Tax=Tenacibaculum mesophilum TaxID=104268 RepID=UPI000A8EB1FA|nr:hypothetical protein [Tenacibaculum mesophilum]
MKQIINLITLFCVFTICAQKKTPCPLVLLDSLLTAIENKDYEKFKRQYYSYEEINSRPYLDNLTIEQRKNEVKQLIDLQNERSIKNYNSLRDTIIKYNLTPNNLKSTSFKYMSRLKNASEERIIIAKNLQYDLVKDSIVFAININPAVYTKNQWKVSFDIDQHTYSLKKENLDKTPYFIESLPDNFIDFGEQVYSFIKNNELKKLERKFATKEDLKTLFYSEKKIENILLEIDKNIERLKTEKKSYEIIRKQIVHKTSILWKKRKYLNEADIRIALYLETTDGYKLLNIFCIASEQKIMIIDISTQLIKAMY